MSEFLRENAKADAPASYMFARPRVLLHKLARRNFRLDTRTRVEAPKNSRTADVSACSATLANDRAAELVPPS